MITCLEKTDELSKYFTRLHALNVKTSMLRTLAQRNREPRNLTTIMLHGTGVEHGIRHRRGSLWCMVA